MHNHLIAEVTGVGLQLVSRYSSVVLTERGGHTDVRTNQAAPPT